METLEKSRMCRLCGKNSGISIDIFDKKESHVRKINAILPILVHEMDMLPKQMCHRCSYKLEEFYNFYVDCAKTDAELKNQLSWMRKDNLNEKIMTPMVKINPFKIKTEPPDNNDSIDPSNVLGQINENSLLFPASILQHSFDQNTSPMLSCSRCQCFCNRSIKVNKSSPKEVKASSKTESENEAHSSNDCTNVSNKKNSESNDETENIDNKNLVSNKSIFENNSVKETNAKEIPVVNLDNNECIKLVSTDNALRSENRALRPRKGSVDYMGQRKKGIASNIKAKFKSKLDILDPALVNPVQLKIYQGNTIHSSPIIKLEKVDDPVRTLRTRKNLEEFNRKIKEFHSKGWHFRNNKELNQNRKSLQKEVNLDTKSFQKEDNQIRISLHKEENQNKKSLSREENPNKKNLQKEEKHNKKNLQAEESQITKGLYIEKNGNMEQKVNFDMENTTNENVNITEMKIKQEVINKTIESNETLEEQSHQEKLFVLDSSKDQKVSKHLDRIPLCAVVKLEKDYTCNVDYPRIKIKRHLAVANPSKSQDVALEDEAQQNNIFELTLKRKSFIKSDNSFSPKNLRSKEKLKVNKNLDKSKKVSKKRGKQLSRIVLEKDLSVVTQPDLKHYCEECDTCFRNKELFRLHPCYQK